MLYAMRIYIDQLRGTYDNFYWFISLIILTTTNKIMCVCVCIKAQLAWISFYICIHRLAKKKLCLLF